MSKAPSPDNSATLESRAEYDAWHSKLEGADALDTPWHRLVQQALSASRDLSGRTVLEIACGRGELSAWCAQRGTHMRFIAADFSFSAVRQARARKSAGVTVAQVDAQALPLPSASVDTVISCETIEHVPHPRAALGEFARVLRPGGRLFLTHPNYLGPTGGYRAYLRMTGRRYKEEDQPINNFLVAPLVRHWLRALGMRIETATAIGHYLPFPGRPPILLAEHNAWLSPFGLHSLTVAEKINRSRI